ncbi:MAG: hypothetical protein LBP59_12605 [Planctomycetaceae bacterium]|jgi:predicted ATP-grasp superfamily ATP-dependent carboligase|nr:hypothetical protein [Planctomycetaceae bacterium]
MSNKFESDNSKLESQILESQMPIDEIVPVVIPVSAHLDGPTLFGTARCLGRCGIPVHVIARGKYPIAKYSRYIKTLTTFPKDPPDEIWIETLNNLLPKINKTNSKPIIFFCTENDLYRFAPLQNYLEQHFQLIPSFNATFNLLEKDKQLPLAKQAGFLIPKTAKLEKNIDLEIIFDTFQFPVIIKPLARHTIGAFDHKGLIIESKNNLNELTGKYLNKPPTVLIAQEYIKGNDNDILFFMGSSDNNGNIRAFVTGRKLRQNPPRSGMMACGYIEHLPDLESKSKTLCKLYKINGCIGVECKRPPETNDYYYIETSFRPETFNEITTGAKLNIVYDTYAAKLGKPCQIKHTTNKGSWYDLFADIDSIQAQRPKKFSNWKCLLKKLPRPITYSHFALDDPMPFFARIIEKIKAKIKRLFKKNS